MIELGSGFEVPIEQVQRQLMGTSTSPHQRAGFDIRSGISARLGCECQIQNRARSR
jgi:hypothetical protein